MVSIRIQGTPEVSIAKRIGYYPVVIEHLTRMKRDKTKGSLHNLYQKYRDERKGLY